MIYVIDSLEFQETYVSFSVNTFKKPKKYKIGENNTSVCMEITYPFIYWPWGQNNQLHLHLECRLGQRWYPYAIKNYHK